MNDRLIAVATSLLHEHATGCAFSPLGPESGVDDLAAAYAVQRIFVELLNPQGIAPAGYKIGLTSVRMQKMCGVETPLAGVVLANLVHSSDVELSLSNYSHLGLEFEIAVRLQRDLPLSQAPFDADAVASAIGGICAAIEVIDDRCADYRSLDARSIISDNAWNAGAVLGRFVKPWPDLAEAGGIVRLNGSDIDRGMGRDVLGHPFVPLTWLANHLAASGGGLRAGQIVLTGSLVPTRFPAIGESYQFEVAGVGTVKCQDLSLTTLGGSVDLGIIGRRALVMGASRGIGRAIAEALLAEGVTVAICARNRERLESTARSIGAIAIPADLSEPGAAAAMWFGMSRFN